MGSGACFVEMLECRCLLSVSVLTYHYNNERTGLNDAETTLTPANVNTNSFGLLFADSVDGKVDAQPLYVPNVIIPGKGTHNVLYVATENDSLYAFDADSDAGADTQPLWKVSLLGAGEVPSDDRGCSQITPTIGITATPVIDPGTNTMYVVAMSKLVSGSTTTYIQRIHAINITTGQDQIPPVVVQASVPGSGANSVNGMVSFIPANYAERAALTLVNGTVYTTWTSHCDENVYNGWIIGYDTATLQQTAVLCTTPNGTEGAFWGSGAGPAVDAMGNLFQLEGNGTFDASFDSQGFPSQQDFGGTFIKVSTSGGLAVSDYFAPSTVVYENANDLDFGSGGVILLPDMLDASGNVQQLAIGAGKDGNIYLVNRNNMGKYDPGAESNIYQEMDGALSGGEWATSAYFNGSVYYGPVGNHLLQFTFSDARLGTSPASMSSNTFGYPGTTPSISANGTTDGIVWAAEAASNGQAVLHAYDATNLADQLYSSTQAGSRDSFGTENKFITPVVADGHVFVATAKGVGVFGLLSTQSSLPGDEATLKSDLAAIKKTGGSAIKTITTDLKTAPVKSTARSQEKALSSASAKFTSAVGRVITAATAKVNADAKKVKNLEAQLAKKPGNTALAAKVSAATTALTTAAASGLSAFNSANTVQPVMAALSNIVADGGAAATDANVALTTLSSEDTALTATANQVFSTDVPAIVGM